MTMTTLHQLTEYAATLYRLVRPEGTPELTPENRLSETIHQANNVLTSLQEWQLFGAPPDMPFSPAAGTLVQGAGTGTNKPWCPNRTYDWHAWYVEENDSVSASLEKLDTAGWEIFSITPYHNPMKPQFVTTQIITRRPVTDAH